MDIYVIKTGKVVEDQLESAMSFESDGFYTTLEMALEAVRENRTDLQERIHTHCVVGRIAEGLCNVLEDCQWFEWHEHEARKLERSDTQWGEWRPIEQPAMFERIAFGL